MNGRAASTHSRLALAQFRLRTGHPPRGVGRARAHLAGGIAAPDVVAAGGDGDSDQAAVQLLPLSVLACGPRRREGRNMRSRGTFQNFVNHRPVQHSIWPSLSGAGGVCDGCSLVCFCHRCLCGRLTQTGHPALSVCMRCVRKQFHIEIEHGVVNAPVLW